MDESTLLREPVTTDVRQTSQVSWGSIFAGWVLAAGVAWLFYTLGAAIGFTVIDPAQDPTVLDTGLSIGAGVWVLLTWGVSLFLGGLFAARLSGKPDRTIGMLHGMAVWGVTTLLTLVLGAMGAAGLFQAGANLVGGAASLGAQAAQGGGGDIMRSLGLEAQIKSNVAQALSQGNVPPEQINQAMNQLDAQTLAQISARLLRGDVDGARNLLALNTTLSQSEINNIVDGLQAQLPQYQQQVQQAAQKATTYSAAVAWTIFAASVIALALAIWGGALGARAVGRRFAETRADY